MMETTPVTQDNDHQLTESIYSSLISDTSHLPALPEITLTIRNKLSNPDCTIDEAAKLLHSDPGLSAYIMRVSNTARYYLRSPPRDLESAILRIGMVPAACLSTTYATRALFDSAPRAIKSEMRVSYRYSTRVSVLSHLIAREVRGVDPSKAMLAGLLLEIGLQPILLGLQDYPSINDDLNARTATIDALCPRINAYTLRHWSFDEDTIDAVSTRKQWLRESDGPVDLGDIVLMAQWFAVIEEDDIEVPAFDELPVFGKLSGDRLEGDNILELIEESRQQIDEMEQALMLDT